jgi:hypothetical protein
MNTPNLEDYAPFPSCLAIQFRKSKILGKGIWDQCDVIENSLGITWELGEQIGSIIENHWEPGGNNLL